MEDNNISDEQIVKLRAHAAGNPRILAACHGAMSVGTPAARAARSLGLVYRRHVLAGPGPARTGWWLEPFGSTAEVFFYGRYAREACRRWCAERS